MPMDSDQVTLMRRAARLARNGWGRVHPNPLVGAVVADAAGVVAEGWHAEYGGPHAERMAIDQAGARARGATLVVTLEPCTHQGQQPPCVDLIRAAEIARVVVALADPNPVAAGGAERLRAAGIDVVVGVDPEPSRRDNFRFLHRFSGRTRPFVAVKLAVSVDGFIADAQGRSRWVSGEPAREWVHWLRAGFGALAVGGSTAVADDASLTVRGSVTPRVPPVRVVFDRSRRLNPTQRIFADAGDVPVHVIRSQPDPTDAAMAAVPGVTLHYATDLGRALDALAAAGVDAILVEGGGRLAGALFEADLVDRVYLVQAPLWLGEGTPAWAGLAARPLATTPRWQPVDTTRLGGDTVMTLDRP